MHVVAAKAVAFGEALRPDFKLLTRAKRDRKCQGARGKRSDPRASTSSPAATDTHLTLVDLRPKRLNWQGGGNWRSAALHITCNKNGVPFDPQKPAVTSGVRLGHSGGGRARGFGIAEFQEVGRIDRGGARRSCSLKGVEEDALTEATVREEGKGNSSAAIFPII